MIIKLGHLFGFFGLFLSAQVLATESTEIKTNGVKFNVKLNLVDQTGSIIKSASFTANFANLLERETLSLMESEDKMTRLVLAPEVTIYGSDVELENEEKKTSELNFTILSLQQSHEGYQTYINFKIGLQDIETTTSAGEESSENDKVVIWNPGLRIPLNGHVDISWEYALSQKNILSDKTQHTSSFNIIYNF